MASPQPAAPTRRSSTRRRFLALCSAAAAAGCATEPPSGTAPSATATADPPPDAALDLEGAADWPMFGHDAANTGRGRTAAALGADHGGAWRAGVEGYHTLAAPSYVDGTVYIASGAYAYAFDARGGATRWRRSLDALAHHYPPAVADVDGGRTAFVVARGGTGTAEGGPRLYALAAADGAVRWTADLAVTGAPTVAGGTVYVASTDGEHGHLHALDAAGGTVEWATALDGDDRSALRAAPAVAGDAVYASATLDADGEAAGALVALDAADGDVRYQVPVADPVRAAPVLDGDAGDLERAFVATTGGDVVAVDAASGHRRWRTAVGDRVDVTPALAAGHLCVFADGELVGLAAEDGIPAWRAPVGYGVTTGLASGGGTVYVAGQELAAVDAADGTVRWSATVPDDDGGWGGPIVVGGAVLAGACIKGEHEGGLYDNYVYALTDAR